jgi:uncharacterized phiE125 gp8 family phage protein
MDIFSSLIVTDEPAVEPVLVEDVKDQLRLDGTADDTMIESLIIASRQATENVLKKKLISTGVRAGYDRFTPLFYLPLAPVISIDSITYIDSAGDQQTLDSSYYTTDLESEPARIMLAEGSSYPETNLQPGAVKVNYTVGYGTSSGTVPSPCKQAIISTVIDLYEHPEMESEVALKLNKTSMMILNSYRNCATVV